jgi:hypothetical protein
MVQPELTRAWVGWPAIPVKHELRLSYSEFVIEKHKNLAAKIFPTFKSWIIFPGISFAIWRTKRWRYKKFETGFELRDYCLWNWSVVSNVLPWYYSQYNSTLRALISMSFQSTLNKNNDTHHHNNDDELKHGCSNPGGRGWRWQHCATPDHDATKTEASWCKFVKDARGRSRDG